MPVTETQSTRIYYDQLAQGQVDANQNPVHLRRFHNQIKRELISKWVTRIKHAKVLDLGCGRLGDIWKFRDVPNLTSYVGVDTSKESMKVGMQRWSERMSHPYRKRDMHVSLRLANMIDSGQWEEMAEYDAITAMFSLAYAINSRETCGCFAASVANSLTHSGRFVITIVDETLVLENIGMKNRIGEIKAIETEYEENEWGQQIEFTLRAANAGVVKQNEFIIPWSQLCQVFEEHGLRLVSTNLFKEIKGFESLPKEEKEISRLYRSAVFERI